MRTLAWIGVSTLILAVTVVTLVTAAPPAQEDTDTPPSGASAQFTTDFSKHSVPYNEILSGGPPKDGIPAVDDPKYVSVTEADEWLDDKEPVLLVEVGDEARVYPIQILMWHEIVNDTLGDLPVSVTYCPLCNTGVAFEREFDGQVRDFGTTGRLRISNLIMYDRQSETWWQQATGEGIAGKYTGEQLNFYPASLVAWTDFKEAHPDGTVLSRDTGYSRTYGRNPYVSYDDQASKPFLFDGQTPELLPAMARVATVDIDGDTVAYPYAVMQEVGVVNDTVGDKPIVVMWEAGTASALDAGTVADGADVGAVTTFSRELDGEILTFALEGGRIVDEQTGSEWSILGEAVSGSLAGSKLDPVISINHFWFSWAAFRPETRVFGLQVADTTDVPEEKTPQKNANVTRAEPTELKADFEISLYQGEDVLGNQLVMFSGAFAQGKPVVAVMWAGLCPLCRAELPELEIAYQEHGDELVMIGVDVGPFVRLGTEEDGRALLDELSITFPAGSLSDPGILSEYGVLGTPATYFFKPNGELLDKWTGRLSGEQVEQFVDNLLQASTG